MPTRESQIRSHWAQVRRREREERNARSLELFEAEPRTPHYIRETDLPMSPPEVALEHIAKIKAKLKATRPDLATEDEDL